MQRMNLSWQFVRFVLVGLVNTFTGLSVIYGMKAILAAGDVLANLVGYAIGLCVSFILNRTWTFRHEGHIAPAAVKFLLVFAVAYVTNLTVVLVCIHWIGLNSYLAQAMGIPPYTIVFFLLSRFFVFGSGQDKSASVRITST